ncbi:MAG TPA: membrane protein insertase YidC, partial [Chromatiales bacterium]|nr:membrane protein insertase YidC [Chromatiales bacterium]
YLLQTGLRASGDAVQIGSQTLFDSPADEYVLRDGQDELVVPLSWTGPDGIRVEKSFRFRRGRYDIELRQQLINNGARPYNAAAYLQIRRRYQPLKRSMFNVDSYSFNGPVAYDGEKYEKLKVDDLQEEPFEQTVTGGWMAAIQHHFLVAAIPPAERAYKYRVVYDGTFFTESTIGAELVTVAPGSAEVFPAKIFVGPKLQKQLAETAEGLPLTVDYGLLTLLAQPLFWLLDKIHAVIGNWGWTIIIVTFLIKLAFYKLTQTSGRSMAKMRKMQPRMKALQERYKDDREAMSRALMDLYKREKVNPAAGCLPMLIQVPFFMAFYWVLLESVEMRQAPFMLWITDLSSRDPYFILPLLMGAAMWFQQKLNPAPPDPMQAKVMMLMPVLFTGMFAFFPAGLVLYWLTNSLLSMLQQWRINKVIGAD